MTSFLVNLRLAARLLAFVIVTLFARIGFELSMLVAGSKRRMDVINWWTPRWAGSLLWIFGIQIEARGPHLGDGKLYPAGDERGVGRIFVMNHRSGTDIPVALVLVAAHPISRHDLATWPILGSGARRIGTLFVDRSNRRSGAAALRQIADALKAGEGVLMFPEGTAYVGDEVHDFKPGAFTTAERTGAEIIPLGVAYGDNAAYYGKQSFMEHMKRIGCLTRLKVAVEAGEPIRLEGREPQEVREIARQRVAELVVAARQRIGPEIGELPPLHDPAAVVAAD